MCRANNEEPPPSNNESLILNRGVVFNTWAGLIGMTARKPLKRPLSLGSEEDEKEGDSDASEDVKSKRVGAMILVMNPM